MSDNARLKQPIDPPTPLEELRREVQSILNNAVLYAEICRLGERAKDNSDGR